MEIGIISFTQAGKNMAGQICSALSKKGHVCSAAAWQKGDSLSQWTAACWKEKKALIFVGAAGIAVRSVAPYLKDKFTDPAVLAADEKGQFVIPLVSGHAGGANELALTLAEAIGAVPVITTATDVNHLFAVDVFAREKGLYLSDRRLAKEVSAGLLSGEKIGWRSDWGDFPVPEGFEKVPAEALKEPGKNSLPERLKVWVTVSSKEPGNCLKLIPKAVVVGIGCRKGTDGQMLSRAVEQMLDQHSISRHAVAGVATIDIKKEEPAIAELVKARDWKLFSYTAQELAQADGEFSESEFVKKTVGVGNVCERAVVCSGAKLLAEKTVFAGITVALGVREKNRKELKKEV